MARTGNWGPTPPQESTEDRQRKYTYEMRQKPKVPSGLSSIAAFGKVFEGITDFLTMRTNMETENLRTDLRVKQAQDAQSRKSGGGGGGRSKGSPVYVPLDESQRLNMAQGLDPNQGPVEEYGPPPPPDAELPPADAQVTSSHEDQLKDFEAHATRIKTAVDQGKITYNQARTAIGAKSRELTGALGSKYGDYHERIIKTMQPITGASMQYVPPNVENSTAVRQAATEAIKYGFHPNDLVGKSAVQIQGLYAPQKAAETQLDLSLKLLQAREQEFTIDDKARSRERVKVEANIDKAVLANVWTPAKKKLESIIQQIQGGTQIDFQKNNAAFFEVKQQIRGAYERLWMTENEGSKITPATYFKDADWQKLAQRFIESHVDPLEKAIGAGNVNAANAAKNQVEYWTGQRSQAVAQTLQDKAPVRNFMKGIADATGGTGTDFYTMLESKVAGPLAAETNNIAAHATSLVVDPKDPQNILGVLKGLGSSGDLTSATAKQLLSTVRDAVLMGKVSKENLAAYIQQNYTAEMGKAIIDEIGGTSQGSRSNAQWGDNNIAAFDQMVSVQFAKKIAMEGDTASQRSFGEFVVAASTRAVLPLMADLTGGGFKVEVSDKGVLSSKAPSDYQPPRPPREAPARAPTWSATGPSNYRLPDSQDLPSLTESITAGTREHARNSLQKHFDKLVDLGKALGEPDPIKFATAVIGADRPQDVIYKGDRMNLGGPGNDPIGDLIGGDAMAVERQRGESQYGNGITAIVNQLQEVGNMVRANPNDPDLRQEYMSLQQELQTQLDLGINPQGLENGIPQPFINEGMGVDGQQQPKMVPAPDKGGEGTVPFSQAEPNAPVKTKSGMIVPLSEYSDGSVKLDWDAGVTGDIKKFWNALQYLASPEAIDNPEKAGYEAGRVALGVLLGGAPVHVPAGSLRTFGGFRGALKMAEAGDGAPLEAMVMAKSMFKKGASIAEVEQATGDLLKNSKVFAYATKGADGKLRFEVADDALKIRPDLEEFARESITADVKSAQFLGLRERGDTFEGTLNDILDGESPLFKMYPELALTKFKMKFDDFKSDVKGNFDPATDTITSFQVQGRPINLDDLRITVLHEMQHMIQKIEGFAPGGNRQDVKRHIINVDPKRINAAKVASSVRKKMSGAWRTRNDLTKKAIEKAGLSQESIDFKLEKIRAAVASRGGSIKEQWDASDKYHNEAWDARAEIRSKIDARFERLQDKYDEIMKRLDDASDPTAVYRQLAGEAEAFLVASERSFLDADWLRYNPATQAYKDKGSTPLERQIVAKEPGGKGGIKLGSEVLKGQKIY